MLQGVRHAILAALFGAGLVASAAGEAAETCAALRPTRQEPADPALCASLDPDIRRPAAFPLGEYEAKLGTWLRGYCHRDPAKGWVTDKRLRDTGPFVGSLNLGTWSGQYLGTHAPVIVWYSPEMHAWMKRNRPDGSELPADAEPVPDGAVMVKEMYPPPGAACANADPAYLQPTSGAAVMVRAGAASHDGWFWGWFGWSGWEPDWPAPAGNSYPNMGFGQYCTNCHGSAKSNGTFASLKNVKGHPGEPLVYLSQNFFRDTRVDNHHILVAQGAPSFGQSVPSRPDYGVDFLTNFGGARPVRPGFDTVSRLPSETYDNVWAMPGSRLANSFVTSDQCLGCHSAGSTGLQYDMTEPLSGGLLLNASPYGTWRSSPMGLSGRDPFFLAQIESETTHFHPGSAALIQDTCFGCHGVAGQRQQAMENPKPDGSCATFERATVDATPLPGDPRRGEARFGALARDGITCLACHRAALGPDADTHAAAPQNRCIADRQAILNPGLSGFARTFTGSFPIAAPDQVFGPFENPKERPMRNAIGMVPQHRETMSSSEVCGSCHVVHLPVLKDDRIVGYAYEQATYAEWLFSAYRAGTGVTGPLPFGPGEQAQSCQDCHMPKHDGRGRPSASKIASIQEFTNFPMTENVLPAREIDLEVREGFARHTLVGLNVFLIKMAQQFAAVLGIRSDDPMLTRRGLAPLAATETAILRQAGEGTADIAVTDIARTGGALRATVAIRSKTGHKFPSGVGFRRAFVAFTVRDEAGRELWASGRTDATGVLRDQQGAALPGELWWDAECKARLEPERRAHLPHFETIRRQSEVQVYQELVAAPGPEAEPDCGAESEPTGGLTTSFLSVCRRVKDNRILPHGYLPAEQRRVLAAAIGADAKLAEETGSVGVGDDPDYAASGGGDRLAYEIPLGDIPGEPRSVEATLYYQAVPPFYMQDRFCTAKGRDGDRLFLLAGFLRQAGTESADWKLRLVSTGPVGVP